MSDNIIISILEKQEKQRKELAKLNEWGCDERRRLVEILENNGATISRAMWDMLLFNITGLRISENEKVCYTSFDKRPSKRILELFGRYNKAIKENFEYIVKGKK